mgnify:CR=1 FL=1
MKKELKEHLVDTLTNILHTNIKRIPKRDIILITQLIEKIKNEPVTKEQASGIINGVFSSIFGIDINSIFNSNTS